MLPLQGTWVQSLEGELRSCKQRALWHGQKEKKIFCMCVLGFSSVLSLITFTVFMHYLNLMFSQQLHDLSSYLVVPLDLINCLTVAPKFPYYFVSWCCLLLSFSFKEMDWINVVRCTYCPK